MKWYENMRNMRDESGQWTSCAFMAHTIAWTNCLLCTNRIRNHFKNCMILSLSVFPWTREIIFYHHLSSTIRSSPLLLGFYCIYTSYIHLPSCKCYLKYLKNVSCSLFFPTYFALMWHSILLTIENHWHTSWCIIFFAQHMHHTRMIWMYFLFF